MAQVILGNIATSIMTVVSIVFAILLMTLTLASMQFSPRIIVSFARDRVTQWTLGYFSGPSPTAWPRCPTARSLPRPFAPVATVLGAMLLALACVGWLLFFIHHISQAISVSHIVDRIASETEAMVDEMMPWPHIVEGSNRGRHVDLSAWDTPVLSDASGYIRFIDIGRLCLSVPILARESPRHPQGRPFRPRRTPLFHGLQGRPAVARHVRGTAQRIDLGPARTLQQDIEFGVLQIVDIALKAISPAVNDPSTGVTCVDQLSRILIRFASRKPHPCSILRSAGVLRVSITWIDFRAAAQLGV